MVSAKKASGTPGLNASPKRKISAPGNRPSSSVTRLERGFPSSSSTCIDRDASTNTTKRPGSTVNTFMKSVTCGGVTLVHVAPPSAVVAMTPSSVPIQMRLMSWYEGPIV